MTVESLESVRKQITVAVPRDRAFEAFAARMAAWWNPAYHLGDEPFAEIVVEPREGGAWYELDAAGARCEWGRVRDPLTTSVGSAGCNALLSGLSVAPGRH